MDIDKEKMTGQDKKRVSIMILNYNGRILLEECLPSVIAASSYNNINCEVVVIDNNSTDQSVKYIEENYPTVKIIKLKENRYLFSYNEAIKDCRSDYVVLLNNDMMAAKTFIAPLLEKMKDEKIFSVMPNIRNWDGSKYKAESNKNRIYFKKGWIDWEDVGDDEEGITFFTCAGAAIYDRRKYLELGGFDELYSPLYVEDVDLSYRAWKRGWVNYYEPDSVVLHKNSSTIKQFYSGKKISTLKIRNKYLFFWKNIQERELWKEHIKLILLTVIRSIIKRETTQVQAFCQALKRVKKLKNRRNPGNTQSNRMSDADILQIFR